MTGIFSGVSQLGGSGINSISPSTTTSFTTGSIIFAKAGVIAQDNAKLFWDDTNFRLGIGTSVPTYGITLASGSSSLISYNTADQITNFEQVLQNWSSNTFQIASQSGGTGTTRDISLIINSKVFTLSNGSSFITANAGTTALSNWFIINGTANNSSTNSVFINISPTILQTSTGGYTGLYMNMTETSTGSGSKNLINCNVGSVAQFVVDNTGKLQNSGAFNIIATNGSFDWRSNGTGSYQWAYNTGQNGALIYYGGTTSAVFQVDSTGLIKTASALLMQSLVALTNAPAVGNPTKWIPINDNGTTRYIPAW